MNKQKTVFDAHKARYEAWRKALDEELELAESKCHAALREGHIEAWSVHVAPCNIPDEYCHSGLDKWFAENTGTKIPRKRMAARDWRRNNIDWKGSRLMNNDLEHWFIVVKGTEVLKAFPPQQKEKKNISSCGASLYQMGGDGVPSSRARAKQPGRPPKVTDDLHVFIAETILKEGGLPKKQESFVADIQRWSMEKKGVKLGRSTVARVTKTYYDNDKIKKSRK